MLDRQRMYPSWYAYWESLAWQQWPGTTSVLHSGKGNLPSLILIVLPVMVRVLVACRGMWSFPTWICLAIQTAFVVSGSKVIKGIGSYESLIASDLPVAPDLPHCTLWPERKMPLHGIILLGSNTTSPMTTLWILIICSLPSRWPWWSVLLSSHWAPWTASPFASHSITWQERQSQWQQG